VKKELTYILPKTYVLPLPTQKHDSELCLFEGLHHQSKEWTIFILEIWIICDRDNSHE